MSRYADEGMVNSSEWDYFSGSSTPSITSTHAAESEAFCSYKQEKTRPWPTAASLQWVAISSPHCCLVYRSRSNTTSIMSAISPTAASQVSDSLSSYAYKQADNRPLPGSTCLQ